MRDLMTYIWLLIQLWQHISAVFQRVVPRRLIGAHYKASKSATEDAVPSRSNPQTWKHYREARSCGNKPVTKKMLLFTAVGSLSTSGQSWILNWLCSRRLSGITVMARVSLLIHLGILLFIGLTVAMANGGFRLHCTAFHMQKTCRVIRLKSLSAYN